MLQSFNEKNKDILIYVKDGLYPRGEAKVSVFDSSVQGGDAAWEGLRVYDGRVFCLDSHLERMHHSAHILGFPGVPSSDPITAAPFETLKGNGIREQYPLHKIYGDL